MIPKLIKINSLPRLTSGKVDKQSLIRTYEESLKSSFTFTDEELKQHVPAAKVSVARIFLDSVAKVLGSADRRPMLDDNFFQIGGDSLNMVQLLGVLSDLGHHIGMTEFVLCKDMAGIVRQLVSGEEQPGGKTYFY